MSVEDVFMGDILENPEDDTLRLVFADWLEEQGDPRGEFIHLQMYRKFSRMPVTPREKELLEENQKQWTEDLPKLGRYGLTYGFRRGFVDTVRGPASLIADVVPYIAERAPISSIDVTNPYKQRLKYITEARQSLDRLFARLPADRIRQMRIEGYTPQQSIGETLKRYGDNLQRLSRVAIDDCEHALPTLLTVDLPSLTHIAVRDSRIGTEREDESCLGRFALQQLVEVVPQPALLSLDLKENPIHKDTAEKLWHSRALAPIAIHVSPDVGDDLSEQLKWSRWGTWRAA